jgi:hypothetical protein
MNAAKRYEKVSALIFQERQRQDDKWGWPQNNSLPIWMTVLGEEYGETCQEVLQAIYEGKSLDDFVTEMIQVAAVAVAALEDLDEQGLIDLSDMNSDVKCDVDRVGAA